MSSVVSYSIFTFFYGTEPIFGIPRFSFHDPRELIFYALLAFVCAAVGWMYIKTFYYIKYSIFFPLRGKDRHYLVNGRRRSGPWACSA